MTQVEKEALKIYSQQFLFERQTEKDFQKIHDSDSEDFQPQYHQIKRLGLTLNKSRLKNGSWTKEQNQKYLQFILNNRENFVTEAIRRKRRVFYLMSKVMRKRTPDQCRSHHQKLHLKYNCSLDLLIAELSAKIGFPTTPLQKSTNKRNKKEDTSGLITMATKSVPGSVVTDWYSISLQKQTLFIELQLSNVMIY